MLSELVHDQSTAELWPVRLQSSCSTLLEHFVQRCTPWATIAHQFPAVQINAMRNMALLAATTDLVLLTEIDMLAGAGLRLAVGDGARFSKLHSSCNAKAEPCLS